jgi:hypothetical protein
MLAIHYSSSAIVSAQGKIDVLRFSDDWTYINSAGREVSLMPMIYKIWRLPGAAPDELLFGAAFRGLEGQTIGYGGVPLKQEWSEAMPKVLGKSYAMNFYAVSTSGSRPRVRKVSEQERLRGEPVLNGYRYISADDQKIDVFNETTPPSGIEYAGKVFARSGRTWGNTVGVISPSGKWLAVLSYTSPEKRTKSRSVLEEGGEPEHGVMYVDVYDPATGKKVLSGKQPFSDAPSAIFDASVWVEDQYLVIPLDFNSRKCLLLTIKPTKLSPAVL